MGNKRVIFHIDVNNAFLSWTAVDLLTRGETLDIRTIPSVIGGEESKRRGIVLAKSPVAKQKGVVTAETIYSAKKKCPDLRVYPPNMSLYKELSKKLYIYLTKYSPVIEQYSIDECFVDLTGTNYLYNDYIKLAQTIKEDIKRIYGFTVNIGIGNNKLCAKMASDFEKPDKVHTLYQEEIKEKLWPLPIKELFMVGKSSAEVLAKLHVKTIEDLAKTDDSLLKKYFKKQAEYLKKASLGIDESEVITNRGKNKCISVSETLEVDVEDIDKLSKILYLQTQSITKSLRKQKLYAKTVAITYKNNLFKSTSHQKKLYNQSNLFEDIYEEVLNVLKMSYQGDKIRNIGVRVTDLVKTKERQLSLFDKTITDDNDKIQDLVDEIQNKYGAKSIMKAEMKEHFFKE